MAPMTRFLLFYWSRGASNSDGWLLHKLIVFMLPRSEQLLRHNCELHREDLYFWMNSPRKRETSGQCASATYDVRCLFLCWSLVLVEPSFGIMLTVLWRLGIVLVNGSLPQWSRWAHRFCENHDTDACPPACMHANKVHLLNLNKFDQN